MHRKKKLALAVTALSIAAIAEGSGAAGAQAQNEILQGTATTNSGGASLSGCGWMTESVGVNFNATGPATGPDGGQFTETNATASVYGHQKPGEMQLRLNIPFTIRSDTTTITGTITNPYPWGGGWVICGAYANGAYPLVGLSTFASRATYTATIQQQGQPPQTISGTAQINGNFYIQPGAQTTVTETLALP